LTRANKMALVSSNPDYHAKGEISGNHDLISYFDLVADSLPITLHSYRSNNFIELYHISSLY